MRAIHNSSHYKELKKDTLEKAIIVISELLKKHYSSIISSYIPLALLKL